jgi:hypothetical protein
MIAERLYLELAGAKRSLLAGLIQRKLHRLPMMLISRYASTVLLTLKSCPLLVDWNFQWRILRSKDQAPEPKPALLFVIVR